MSYGALPPKQGLYDPQNEHDACGVGFVADIKGRKSHDIVEQGLTILDRLTHRGARFRVRDISSGIPALGNFLVRWRVDRAITPSPPVASVNSRTVRLCSASTRGQAYALATSP